MNKEKQSCYNCDQSDWDADGCICKLYKCNVHDPKSGCPLHEFTLHSATKYDDGTPITSEPKTDFNSSYPKSITELSNQLDYLERAFKGFAKTQDELIEEYDATLKIHGDTLEDHMERITINEDNIDSLCIDVEDLQRKVYQIYQFLDSLDPDFFARIQDEKFVHKGSDFCGNCAHVNNCRAEDGIYACELSGEIVDPDDSSCSMFEPPF